MVRALNRDCVAVAASDVDYAHHPDPSNWEVRWLRDALADARHGLFQGIYVVTPAGQLLGQLDGGWPVYDVEHARRELARAVQRYRALPRERRLLERLPDPATDRAFPREPDGPAEGHVRLVATKRARPFRGMQPSDVRHPQHLHHDRVDVPRALVDGLVPTQFEPGRTQPVDDALLATLLLECFVQPECNVWREHEITTRELTATVVRRDGDVLELRFDGRLVAAAKNEWNAGAHYDGRIGGRATWNRATHRFTSFDLALFGAHTLNDQWARERPGARTIDVAVHVTLAPRPETDAAAPVGEVVDDEDR